jgi:hypothetical protein
MSESKPVATEKQLVPPVDREQVRAAAERIRKRRPGVRLCGIKIKDLIAEGRR